MDYCDFCNSIEDPGNIHKKYHDGYYGFPIKEDHELFCRLVLEINQAGLSWEIILKKERNFRVAFDLFNIQKVALYDENDRQRLLNNAGIIRNKLKVNAAIENAKRIVELQQEFGSFKNWLDKHHPMDLKDWVKLFKKNFRFTGGEIVNEFLMSTGYLPGAHKKNCPVYQKVLKAEPSWLTG